MIHVSFSLGCVGVRHPLGCLKFIVTGHTCYRLGRIDSSKPGSGCHLPPSFLPVSGVCRAAGARAHNSADVTGCFCTGHIKDTNLCFKRNFKASFIKVFSKRSIFCTWSDPLCHVIYESAGTCPRLSTDCTRVHFLFRGEVYKNSICIFYPSAGTHAGCGPRGWDK